MSKRLTTISSFKKKLLMACSINKLLSSRIEINNIIWKLLRYSVAISCNFVSKTFRYRSRQRDYKSFHATQVLRKPKRQIHYLFIAETSKRSRRSNWHRYKQNIRFFFGWTKEHCLEFKHWFVIFESCWYSISKKWNCFIKWNKFLL